MNVNQVTRHLPRKLRTFVLETLLLLRGQPIFLSGPPGTGKTLAARSLAEVVCTSGLAYTHGEYSNFRAPHHTASLAAMWGAPPYKMVGQWRPGEIDLAKYGMLFLDELPEFDRILREVLPGLVKACGEAAPWIIGTWMDCPCGSSFLRPCKCSGRTRDSWGEIQDSIKGCLGKVGPVHVLPMPLIRPEERFQY